MTILLIAVGIAVCYWLYNNKNGITPSAQIDFIYKQDELNNYNYNKDLYHHRDSQQEVLTITINIVVTRYG